MSSLKAKILTNLTTDQLSLSGLKKDLELTDLTTDQMSLSALQNDLEPSTQIRKPLF